MNYSPNLVAVQFVELDGKMIAKGDVKATKGTASSTSAT
jgi:hypothetical protein